MQAIPAWQWNMPAKVRLSSSNPVNNQLIKTSSIPQFPRVS
jgi:hypothetical protein